MTAVKKSPHQCRCAPQAPHGGRAPAASAPEALFCGPGTSAAPGHPQQHPAPGAGWSLTGPSGDRSAGQAAVRSQQLASGSGQEHLGGSLRPVTAIPDVGVVCRRGHGTLQVAVSQRQYNRCSKAVIGHQWLAAVAGIARPCHPSQGPGLYGSSKVSSTVQQCALRDPHVRQAVQP